MSSLDSGRVDALARIVDEAAESHQWSSQIVRAITAAGDSAEVRLLASAFYDAQPPGSDAHGRRTRFLLTDSGLEEVEPSDVDEESWEVWEAIASRAIHPRVRSTPHDLLFWGRHGDVGTHAREAAQAYIDLITQAESIAKVDSANRAFALIRLAGLDALREEAVENALGSAQAVLNESESPKPGVSLGLLEALVNQDIDDERVDELLARCREVYPGAWHTSSTIELQRKRARGAEERRDLDRQETQAWLDEAAASEPLTALIHYQRAANLAADRGITDLRDQAIRELQAIGPEDLPLQRITSSVEIPREQIDEYIEELVGDDSWWNALLRIVLPDPPSGRLERNRAQAAQQAEAAPLLHIVPATRLGRDGLPRYQAETDAEREDEALARNEVMGIQLMTHFAGEALERATERYGAATRQMISEQLRTNAAVDDITADAVGRVVERFERRDYEAAAYTALPLIERFARDFLLQLDAPIYRTQKQRTPGQYPGLGALLHELSKIGLDPSWHRYLHTLLTSPFGLNFRNEALHGFVDETDRSEAVAVLIALFYLAFIGPGEPPAGT